MKKNITKIVGITLALVMVLAAPVSANTVNKPVSVLSAIEVNIVPDTVSDWTRSSVEMALKHNLIPDTLQTKYTETITRGEYATLIARLYEKIKGTPIVERKTFTDTKSTDIEKVAGLGIITGLGDGTFGPNNKITREQTAVVIYRLMTKLGHKFYQDYEEFDYYLKEETKGISTWAREPAVHLFYESIVSIGDSYRPKEAPTVEESIHQLMRVFYLTSNHQFEGYTKSSQDQAKQTLNTFKSKYPTGTPWGYEKEHQWREFTVQACAAFGAELSDAVFGDLPVHTHSDLTAIKIGDVLSVNNSSHAVIVIDIVGDGVIVAEGNYNGQVRWGAKYTLERLKTIGTYVQTRYPKIYSYWQ